MQLLSGLTFLYVVLPLALTWFPATEGRRDESKLSPRLECLGKDKARAECKGFKNEVECGSHRLNSNNELVLTSQWTKNRNMKKKKSCKWKIQTAENVELRITCQLSLKTNANCRSNLYITDGKKRRNKLCGKERTIGLTSDTGLLKIISKIDRQRRNSNNFECTVRAHPKQIQPDTQTIVDGTVSSKCRCGRENGGGRIVGGREVKLHQYPWQVAIMTQDIKRPFCGGSIISDSWILTAAHCLFGRKTEDIRVVIGEHDWSTPLETNITRTMKAKLITRHYNFFLRKPLENDIGLIQLEEPLIFPEDNSIAPVCLPPPTRAFDNVDAVVVGWGSTENRTATGPSKVLMVTDAKTMTNDLCQSMFTIKGPISDTMICAGFLFGGENACHGDSGGPLLTKGDGCGGNCLIHIGIVSWGSFCNLGVLPTVYTRTNRYLDWIRMYTRGSMTCQRET